MNESLNALRTSIELNEKKFNSELKNLKEELANSKNELKIKNTQHAQEVIILKEKIEYLSASNLQLNEEMKTMANTNAKLNEEMKTMANTNAKLNEEMKTMANTNAKLNEEINVLKKKVATLEENYDYMKALNLQIILDATKKNNEKEESKETNVNAYIRLLNLLSSDYCLLESKLKEKDGEIFRLKNELKGEILEIILTSCI
jgi:predicted nuclease with TOPRIM domain